MWCWGRNDSGQLGLGVGGDTSTPRDIAGSSGWAQLSLGASHACGIKTADQSLWCWGENGNGQLGIGVTGGARDVPMPVMGGGAWSQVSAGLAATCAIRTDGALLCWGYNFFGQLGIGTSGANTDTNAPKKLAGTWSKVSLRTYHTCAIQMDGSLWCWGNSSGGRLGLGDAVMGNVTTPAQVGDGVGWTSISTGDGHSCGIQGGALLCWGQNYFGELGTGQEPPNNPPLTVPSPVGTLKDWTLVVAGANHTCGLRSATNLLSCWGYNYYGQVGNGSSGANATVYQPTGVAFGRPWLTLAAGEATTCGVAMDANLFCWGSNNYGLVGNGNAGQIVVTPVQVDSSKSWAGVGLMTNTGCALHTNGSYACWGQSSFGHFGDGTSFYENPARVVDPH
jgi:alpha-tubulin suppressor-like RCC1 family protein